MSALVARMLSGHRTRGAALADLSDYIERFPDAHRHIQH
jgi:hypothetical protein